MLKREIIEALTGADFRPLSFRDAWVHLWPNLAGLAAAMLTFGAALVVVSYVTWGVFSTQASAFIAGPTIASMYVVNQRVRRRRATPPTWADSALTWVVLAAASTVIWFLLARIGMLGA